MYCSVFCSDELVEAGKVAMLLLGVRGVVG